MTKTELARTLSKIHMVALDGLLAAPFTPDGVRMGEYFCKIFDLAIGTLNQYTEDEIKATTPYEKI